MLVDRPLPRSPAAGATKRAMNSASVSIDDDARTGQKPASPRLRALAWPPGMVSGGSLDESRTDKVPSCNTAQAEVPMMTGLTVRHLERLRTIGPQLGVVAGVRRASTRKAIVGPWRQADAPAGADGGSGRFHGGLSSGFELAGATAGGGPPNLELRLTVCI